MANQIHMAGSTWIRGSRQLVTRSLRASYSMTKAPTTRASGASHARERLSRSTACSTAASSPSRMASTSRPARARQTVRRFAGSSGAFPSVDISGYPSARVVRGIEPWPPATPFCPLVLLAGHGHAHLAFGVGDEVAGQVDGDGVQGAGEREGGLVVRSDGRAGIGAG